MSHPAEDQRLPAEFRTFYSSNCAEGEVCFRHLEPPLAIGPVFGCESCGGKFCPVCATGVWHEARTGGHGFVWYHCPFCPVGLAFIALPQARAARPGWWEAQAATHPVLQTRPGAYYRLLYPAVKRRGSYQAFWDVGGLSLLELDGREWLRWVQEGDAVRLEVAPAVSPGGLVPCEKGEFLLDHPPAGTGAADASRDAAQLALFLELPQGYQEYDLPEGWPGEGVPRPLRVTDRVWERKRLLQVLPGLAGAGLGASPPEPGRWGMAVAEPWRRVA